MRRASLASWLAIWGTAAVSAQAPGYPSPTTQPPAHQGERPGDAAGNAKKEGALWLVVDADDDDGDGVPDRQQRRAVPSEDLLTLAPAQLAGAQRVSLRGNQARLIIGGDPSRTASVALRSIGAAALRIQGLRPGTARLRVEGVGVDRVIPLYVAAVSVLGADNTAVDPATGALQISLRITNDDSLPRAAGYAAKSQDRRNLRVELVAPTQEGRAASVTLTSYNGRAQPRDALRLGLARPRPGGAFRSPFVRLVSDAVDAAAPGVAGRVLRVSLRDRVRVSWQSPTGPLHQDVPVGRPGGEGGPAGALAGRLRLVILRSYAGGPPVIGRDATSAIHIAQEQVRTANETWAQCGITFGSAAEAAVTVSRPPPPSLAAIADGDGLPARGGGVLQLRVDGKAIGPLATRAGARPIDTAMDLAQAIRAAGFAVRVTENPRTQFGVHGSADLLVRSRSGALATLSTVDGLPLSTDRRQSLAIGTVDLSDGLSEFDNMNARVGTLEERSLIKALSDDDPSTIEVFIVNRFASGTRQGEAFIEASQGAIMNTLVIDRNGLMQRDTAWTLGHELGHVLLDEPLHPDNLGPDRPWLLMDSDSNRGTVYGPKRLSIEECTQARFESGPSARPALLYPVP